MNIERIKQWTAALRSDTYAQGDGALLAVTLDSPDGEEYRRYCCLGVACELAGLSPDVVWDEDDYGDRLTEGKGYYKGQSELPPQEFAEWLGWEDPDEYPADTDGVDWRLDFPDEWEDTPLGYTQGPTPGSLVTTTTHRARLSQSMTCASLNDSGFTFEQIADCIDYFGLAGPN